MGEDVQPVHPWADYYSVTADRPPRELLKHALAHVQASESGRLKAIDIGCGAGVEAAALLRLGWSVLAIDRQPEALARLQARTSPDEAVRLAVQQATFADMELTEADFVWAGLSLPFCAPESFPGGWDGIVSAVRGGGVFAGDFFGPRHFFATDGGMTFLSAQGVRELFKSFSIEYFLEEEGTKLTATKGLQHWHGYSVIARRS